jgi:hypothetical protein
MAALCLGIPLAGCASITQDVDAYYRQMAVNYQDAIDRAKVDEVSVEDQSRVLAATGDQRKYRKSRRELEKIRSWEEHCAWEKKRFEKAAEWMERHFELSKRATAGAPVSAGMAAAAARDDPGDTGGHNIPQTLTD